MNINKFLILLLAALLLGCQEVKTQSQAPQENLPETQTQKAEKPRQRGNMILSQARPADQIHPDYPYDIELKAAGGDIANSASVLPQNGRPTVLLFWLTTCGPCRMEMAAIKKEYQRWSQELDFNFFAISTDFQKNYPKFVKMVEAQDWPWPTYNDHKREFGQIMPGRLNGLPQTFVLNPNGEIVYHKRKYRPGDEAALFEAMKKAARG